LLWEKNTILAEKNKLKNTDYKPNERAKNTEIMSTHCTTSFNLDLDSKKQLGHALSHKIYIFSIINDTPVQDMVKIDMSKQPLLHTSTV
jgi:hypothetical protein